MSVQVEKSPNPFALFCSNLFRLDSNTNGGAQQQAVTAGVLAGMPKRSQLLLGYALQQGNANIMVLDDDTDVSGLITAGWLKTVACPTAGVRCFKIEAGVWHKLRKLGAQFLTDHLRAELTTYCKEKTALYPWVW